MGSAFGFSVGLCKCDWDLAFGMVCDPLRWAAACFVQAVDMRTEIYHFVALISEPFWLLYSLPLVNVYRCEDYCFTSAISYTLPMLVVYWLDIIQWTDGAERRLS